MEKKVSKTLLRKLPLEMRLHIIEPYTRSPQPKIHMENMRHFTKTFDSILKTYYTLIRLRNEKYSLNNIEIYSVWNILFHDVSHYLDLEPHRLLNVTWQEETQLFFRVKTIIRRLIARFTLDKRQKYVFFVENRFNFHSRHLGDILG